MLALCKNPQHIFFLARYFLASANRSSIAWTEHGLQSDIASALPRIPRSNFKDCTFQRWLAEFPDKEIQLHLVEAHGQLVMENSSPEETAHVQAELDQLKESWRSLKEMATG